MPYIINDHQQLFDYPQQRTEAPRRHRRLRELLVSQGHISAAQLQGALNHQEQDSHTGCLGQILLKQELVDRYSLACALVEQLDIA